MDKESGLDHPHKDSRLHRLPAPYSDPFGPALALCQTEEPTATLPPVTTLPPPNRAPPSDAVLFPPGSSARALRFCKQSEQRSVRDRSPLHARKSAPQTCLKIQGSICLNDASLNERSGFRKHDVPAQTRRPCAVVALVDFFLKMY